VQILTLKQFERVYALGLKERSDKRDAITLGASLTGFEVEFVEGVTGEEVLDKARPPVCLCSIHSYLYSQVLTSRTGYGVDRRSNGLLAGTYEHNSQVSSFLPWPLTFLREVDS
jgi:hypothetical protein